MKMGEQERGRISEDLAVLVIALEAHKKSYEKMAAILFAIEHEMKNGRDHEVLQHHFKVFEDVLDSIEAARAATIIHAKKTAEKHASHLKKLMD